MQWAFGPQVKSSHGSNLIVRIFFIRKKITRQNFFENFIFTKNEEILTSAVVSNVRLGTQATLLRIANGISRAIAINVARNYADTLDVRIRIRNSSLWTGARVRTLGIRARGPMTASI